MSFLPIDTMLDFLQPVNKFILSDDQGYKNNQLGHNIQTYEEQFPSLENVDIILIGCGENRGAGSLKMNMASPDAVRKELYSLYHWHQDIRIADAGNIKTGATLHDTYAALKTVVAELMQHTKKVVIIGGSHDLTLAQYGVYENAERVIEAACVDAMIDINMDSVLPCERFLMRMLTANPNFIRQYNHIGFQSYMVHPDMLETIDKLHFDCYRVGKVKERIEEMEPVIRNANLFSFDISAIQNAHAPANRLTPNGFNGEEACVLMQYAGMSANVNTVGIYGYMQEQDVHNLTAKQISHMLWYLMDGMLKGKQEAALIETENFSEYKMAFAEVETTFLQSKKTGRWWMRLPEGNFIACSHNDYLAAKNNEIPERWMRAVERS